MNIPAAVEELFPRAQKYSQALEEAALRYGTTTPLRAANWLGQCAHESGDFRHVRENLNYSPEALMRTWPSRFPTLDLALQYAHMPDKIANRVYGGRLGNGDEASGDGARFIGRGLIQLTGRSNYAAASAALYGDDRLLANPEMVEGAECAALTAGWFWDARHLNSLADRDDLAGITKRINGGLIGIDRRRALVTKFKEALS